MTFYRWSVLEFLFVTLATVVSCFTMIGVSFAQTQALVKQGSVEHIKVHGKSLEGNLEKDSPDRDVFIYLPPDCATNATKRYPVVYLLHGYGLAD